MLNGGGRPGGIEPSGIHCCCWFIAPQCSVAPRSVSAAWFRTDCGMTQSRKSNHEN